MALDVHPSNCPEDRSPSRVALRAPPQGLEQPSTVAGGNPASIWLGDVQPVWGRGHSSGES